MEPMLWLEEKYINLISPRLKLFKKSRHNQWVFRCPICGDSKKNPTKTRGGIYLHPRGTSYTMGCFNCGASMSFTNFLKLQDPYLFNEFIVEKYKTKNDLEQPFTKVVQPVPEKKKLHLGDLERISDLSLDHPAVKYLQKRKIDPSMWDRLYFVLRFKKWEAEFRKVKLDPTIQEHPRLIIPFFDARGNITRISARAFGKEDPKYVYMKVMDDASRVYGLDTVNKKETVYVFEGPLDSLFIPNSIAVGSASLIVPELCDYRDFVLIPDNQPRNPEVCKQIKKMVDSGSKVCLWNEYWGKDVNDMVLAGHSTGAIKGLIDASTVSGIAAQLRFSEWCKVRLS